MASSTSSAAGGASIASSDLVSPLFRSPMSPSRKSAAFTAGGGMAAPSEPPQQSQPSLATLHSSLPPYQDSEFSAAASEWRASMDRARQAASAGSGTGEGTSAEGLSPRTASLLDRSWLHPSRLAKRMARSYSSRGVEIARFQTAQFRQVFGAAALGDAQRRMQQLQMKAENQEGAAGVAGVVVELHAMRSETLRPHMRKAESQPLLASALTRGASPSRSPLKPSPLTPSSSTAGGLASPLAPRTPGSTSSVRAVLASKAARAHPPPSSLSPRKALMQRKEAERQHRELEEEKDEPQPTVPLPADSLMLTDLTGLKPRTRPLNRAARPGSDSSSSTAAQPARPPLSSLAAQDDSTPLDADDAVSDVEINYDSLLSTDDSDDGLDELASGVRLRRHKGDAEGALEEGRRRRLLLRSNAHFSASMLLLNGAKLPEWPHTVESEEELDEEDELQDGDEEEEEEGDEQRRFERSRRKHRPPRPNSYALAAEQDEHALHFLASAGSATAAQASESTAQTEEGANQALVPATPSTDAPPAATSSSDSKKKSKPSEQQKPPESFENGKRVLISHGDAVTPLDRSLRSFAPLDRVRVVSAENLLKRLAKESLRRGGEYARLSEEQILARLEAERKEEEERVRREMGLDRVMPTVLTASQQAGGEGGKARPRHLSELTPMQQKNLSDREMALYIAGEQEAVRSSDGSGGTVAQSSDAPPSSRSFLKAGQEVSVVDREVGRLGAAAEKKRKQLRPIKSASKPAPLTTPIVDQDGHMLPQFRKKRPGTAAPTVATGDADLEPEGEGAPQESTDALKAREPLPLALRPKFSALTRKSDLPLSKSLSTPSLNSSSSAAAATSTPGSPPAAPTPTFTAAPNPHKLRPPLTLRSEVERWLRAHGQVVRRKLDPASLARYRAIFSLLDEDGSGTLSLQELQAALSDIGVHIRLDELAEMANAIKAESLRAQSMRRRNLISFDEFVLGLARAGEWDTLCKLGAARKARAAEKSKAQRAVERKERAEARRQQEALEGLERRKAAGESLVDALDAHDNPFHSPMPSATHSSAHSALPSAIHTAAHTPRLAHLSRRSSPTPSDDSAPTLSGSSSSPLLSVPTRSSPLIGGAGLAGDSVTGAHMQEDVLINLSGAHELHASTPDPVASSVASSSRRRSISAAAAHGSRRTSPSKSDPASTADLLPFTLWVPAFSRYKRLHKLMSIERLSDAQLAAAMDEEEESLTVAGGGAAASAEVAARLREAEAAAAAASGLRESSMPPPHARAQSSYSSSTASPRKKAGRLPILSSSSTYIRAEELLARSNPTPAPGEEKEGVSGSASVSVSGTRPASGASSVAVTRPSSAAILAAPKRTGKNRAVELEQFDSEEMRAVSFRRLQSRRTPSEELSAQAASVLRSALQTTMEEGSGEGRAASPSPSASPPPEGEEEEHSLASPPFPRLDAPAGAPVANPHRSLHASLGPLVSASQKRLAAAGFVLDVAAAAGTDLLHPDPARPFFDVNEVKMYARKGAAGAEGDDEMGAGEGEGGGSKTTASAAAAEPPDSFIASGASSRLPFLWRQTQENVRVAHLQTEADAARAALDSALAADKRGAAGGALLSDESNRADALEQMRRHEEAKEKQLALLRETESKRITRDIFDEFNRKQRDKRQAAQAEREDKKKQRDELAAATASAAGSGSTSSDTGKKAPSTEELLNTRYQPPVRMSFSSNNVAAQMFATAANARSVRDSGVSTQMLAAQMHLRREQDENARLASWSAARRQRQREQSFREVVLDSKRAAKQAAKDAERKARKEAQRERNGGGDAGAETPLSQRSRISDVSDTGLPPPIDTRPPLPPPPPVEDQLMPLPPLDFLAGARLRAQLALAAETRAAIARTVDTVEQLGEMRLSSPRLETGAAGSNEASADVTRALEAGALNAPALLQSQKANEQAISASLSRLQSEIARADSERASSEEAEAQQNRDAIRAAIAAEANTDPGALGSRTDYSSITRVWNEAGKHIEASRRQLREKERAEATRVRRKEKELYARQAAQAYGANIVSQAGGSTEGLSDDDSDLTLDGRRHAQLEYLLFSSMQPSAPDAKPKRSTLTDSAQMEEARKLLHTPQAD